mgnify:CR=1 FL=1|jgi:lactate racemase
MDIKLTKHIFGDLRVNSKNLIGVYGPRHIEGEGLSDIEIREAIDNPIGTEPLSKLAKNCKSVLIVTDDNTRATPLSRILPPILDVLKEAGVNDTEDGITLLIGLGTHRPMTDGEIVLKFGVEIAKKYRIVNHAWSDPESLVSLGSCEFGFEVVINRLVQSIDLLICIGSIVPHATAGFSGGGKAIMPGICGEKTLENTHWMALDYSMHEILGNNNNPIRAAINSICRKINLKMIVNTILFNGERVYGVVSGDVEMAHSKGVDLCREVYGVSISEKADIVIAEAYPTDIDLRQAIKAICTADLVCRDGGIIILTAECSEGVAPQFPEFVKCGFRKPDELYRDVKNGTFKQKLMAYTLIAIGRIISDKKKAILISPNIERDQIENMGFIWSSDLQSALENAYQMTCKDSKVIVLKQAGELLPIL